MANSVRELIVNAVGVRLQAITVANGYETNLGAGLNLWRVTDFADSELPVMNLRDVECVTDQLIGNHHEHRLKLEVVAVSKIGGSDDNAGVTSRRMLADIWKAIGVDRKWSSLALDTNPLRDSTQVEQEKHLLISVKVEFEIKYRTQSYNPYA